ASVSKAIDQARAVGAQFLKHAVLRVTRGASEQATDRVVALGHDALSASRTLDDAVRQYLSENGGPSDQRAPVVRAANRANRVRAAAELIADVVPPPLGVYARTREVIEEHAAAICARLTGDDATAVLVPIGESFVVSLRAEAAGTDLAVSAALPLVTAAAHLGELELLYPQPAESVG
ncbi:hypothetical protein ACWGPP_18840, partial [Agromyces sp. NPDC055657]